MRTVACILLIGFASLAGVPGPAQDSEAPQDLEAKKAAVIREMLEVTGASKMGLQIVEQMRETMRPLVGEHFDGFWEEFTKSVDAKELEDQIVPIYARHFDLAELEGLLEFNKSPLGRKLNQELPAITQESMAVGMAWGQRIGTNAMKKYLERDRK